VAHWPGKPGEEAQFVSGTDMTVLAQCSPVHQLDGMKVRVMLIVGGRDTRVPPVQGMDMHIALLQRKIAHVWLYKPDEWHGFYNQQNIAELFEKVDAFLAANIGPVAGAANARRFQRRPRIARRHALTPIRRSGPS
jgi:dipeptidyl aminopeptidase/acylaminoacyl peptidase